ncbi:MAG: GatB/YqeY domain-containing protein [Chloroflexota bacterium]
MSVRAKLTADMKTAMKEKDTQTRDTLRLVMAAIKQVEVDNKVELDDQGITEVLTKQAKQRRESIADYEKAGRTDLADVEKADLLVIERYLPKMMSKEDIHAIAAEIIADMDTSNPKVMGQIMGKLMPKVKGKADGRIVNEVVREILQG